MSRPSSLRLACLVLCLFALPALVRAQTPPPPGLPAPEGLIAADADQRRFPPLFYPYSAAAPRRRRRRDHYLRANLGGRPAANVGHAR